MPFAPLSGLRRAALPGARVTFCSRTPSCGVRWNPRQGAPGPLVPRDCRLFQDDRQARVVGGASPSPPIHCHLWAMGGNAVALPCPLKLQSGSCGGQWADGSCRPQAPGEGHWEADRKGAKGEMNTEPRNRCVWPTSSAGPLDHQRRPLHVAKRKPGCQPCPGPPPPEPAVTQNLAKCLLLLIVSPPQPSDRGAERYCPLLQCWPGCGCGSRES